MLKENLYLDTPPLTTGAAAIYPYTDALWKHLSARDRFGEEYNYARRVGDTLVVPRGLARMRPVGKDHTTLGRKLTLDLSASNKPRNDEQKRVLKESYTLLFKGYSHIIEGSTGFGKTYVGLTLAGMLSLKTLVVVHKEDLLEQWLGDAKAFLNLTDDDIGFIQQDVCDVAGKKLVIAMVQSLSKEKYDPAIYSEFGFVIFDEVHHMAAEKFSIAASLFHAKLRLGLSATVNRIDGREGVFEAHIGEVMVRVKFIAIPPKVLTLKSPWKIPLVPRKVRGAWKTVPLPHEHGKLGHVLTDIAKCQPRNNLIVRAAALSWAKQRYTLVLSDLARDKHLNLLHDMAVAAGVPKDDIGFYVGGMKHEALERTKTKHLVFATYQMAGEATDVPWWETAVLATPRANVQQAVGRILRPWEDKKEPVVFDIVDDDSTVLVDYAEKRLKTYALLGGKVIPAHLD